MKQKTVSNDDNPPKELGFSFTLDQVYQKLDWKKEFDYLEYETIYPSHLN